MKKFLAVALFALLAAGLLLWFKAGHLTAPARLGGTATPAATLASNPATPVLAVHNSPLPAGVDASSLLASTNLVHELAPAPTAVKTLPPLTVLDNARVILHNYNAAFGENPVGDNAEITAALRGKNPKQITFLTEESGLRVNDAGELLDAWGTPFFFHALSGKLMEIRSAGQDRKMWTLDDQVTR